MAAVREATYSSANRSLLQKEQRLRALMHGMGSVLVAYSGGVDSSYLAYVANETLGESALSVIGISPSVSAEQRKVADEIARDFGFNYRKIETAEFDNLNYTSNPSNRCYYCKSELYSKLKELAHSEGRDEIVDGSNLDDMGDHRPGRQASTEKGVRSPLIEAGLTKAEIRELSRAAGLPTWDKPSSPCLSSRIAYGTPVTIGRLEKVEHGEKLLRELGFREFRVRVHEKLVRLEIAPEELNAALEPAMAKKLAEEFRKLGFQFVTLDLHGYRSGSLNEVI